MVDVGNEADDPSDFAEAAAVARENPSEGGASVGPSGEEDQPSGSKKVVAKFLVSNAAAGSIIGRGGSNISQLQQQSGARLQLSRSQEYFPGTTDRVMLAAGAVNQVLTALHLVLTKVQSEQAVLETMMARDGKNMQLRLLVPSALCGSIIGKSGAIIRGFSEDSKAAITVSGQDRQPPGVTDRVVRITGKPDHLMRAVALLLTKLSENPNFARFINMSVQYGTASPTQAAPYFQQGPEGHHQGAVPGMPAPLQAGPQHPPQQHPRRRHAPLLEGQEALPHMPLGAGQPGMVGPRTEMTIGVPEARVGAVIGRGGEVINQLKTVVGVKIRISERDDFMPGTRNRKITISGPADNVQIAHTLILQKINQG